MRELQGTAPSHTRPMCACVGLMPTFDSTRATSSWQVRCDCISCPEKASSLLSRPLFVVTLRFDMDHIDKLLQSFFSLVHIHFLSWRLRLVALRSSAITAIYEARLATFLSLSSLLSHIFCCKFRSFSFFRAFARSVHCIFAGQLHHVPYNSPGRPIVAL
jgi:hypothetical protein